MQVDPELIDFLSRPESYREKTVSIARHETHISLVFVGNTIVYKIKKPVDFGFLDFTTLEKRHFFCLEEVRLNKRLAPRIYLNVVPIYRSHGQYSFRREPDSIIVEYAVRMRRFSEDRLLYHLVRQGRLLHTALDQVGATIARFHTDAPVHRDDPFGSADTVRFNTEENFDQIASCRGITLDGDTYSRIVSYTRGFLEENGGLFEARKRNGFAREGHGDLHSRHVVLTRPPVVVDCIEFNKRFRVADVLEDLGFLLMDLEYQGRFDLAAEVSNAYFLSFPEAFDPELLRFYKIYRAVVRGKIEGFTADVLADGREREEAERRAREYYLLACHYIDGFGKVFNPLVFMGLSGSGKSSIAQGLLDGADLLRSDMIRKEITGRQDEGHVYVEYGTDMYADEITARVYRAMAERAANLARLGKRVVVDATFLASSQRHEFYKACMREGLNPFFVYCFADAGTLEKRIRRRMKEGRDLSDAHIGVLERQLRIVEEPSELPFFRVQRLDTSKNKPVVIRQALRRFL